MKCYSLRITFYWLALIGLLPLNTFAQNENPLLSGLYNDVQAERGKVAYTEHCASCHANDLRGNSNSPGLIGVGFLFLWEGRPLSELFDKMRNEMPTDRPGSLPASTYSDLLAFLLQENKYPSSATSLTMQSLQASPITIVAPPP